MLNQTANVAIIHARHYYWGGGTADQERQESVQPIASVIVLGYNGREFLEDCLSSLLDQDLPSAQYEVLYVDNDSRDGSATLVRERFPQVRVLELDRNHGYAEGNNIGFRLTRGELIVFLNQDTIVHRSWLRELIEGLRSSPDIMAGHANIIHPWYPEYSGLAQRADVSVTYTPELTRLGYARYLRLGPIEQPRDVLFLSGACLIVRRQVIDELDYVFDPDFFAYAEDMDLGLRIRALGYRCVVVPKAVVYHKHRLKADLGIATVVKTVRIIRNRYLAFYKVMSWREFIPMAALLTIGAPLNALEFGLRPWQGLLYVLALVPTTLMALAAALWNLPRYSRKRRDVRARSARRGDWCLRAVWRSVGAPVSKKDYSPDQGTRG